ncbi:hypothetical protein V1512DRAFT_210065 [Lipomyces arxii]|uniref:uncharacterized protein n=1 Tax=Lipomyces arxii TaxID=56418 RepID=UPI0034CF34F0
MSTEFAKDQPEGFKNYLKKIAIVGAGGHVGSYIVKELLKTGKHEVIALTRADSKSKIADGVTKVVVDYDDESTVVAALAGVDFLIVTMSVLAPRDLENKIIAMAAKAGVKYVMPNVFAGDVMNEKLVQEATFTPGFKPRAKHIEDLGMKWIALACGFWYEHSVVMGPDWFGFDFKNHVMTFYDDGKTMMTVGTFEICGEAVAALLSLPVLPKDENDNSVTLSRWFNKPVYVASFRICQKDMFDSILRMSGEKEEDWKIVYQPSAERYQEAVATMKQGGPLARVAFARAMYSRMFFPTGEADCETMYGLSNEVLGLPEYNLDEHSKNALQMIADHWSYFG